jgi:hypothetical protein
MQGRTIAPCGLETQRRLPLDVAQRPVTAPYLRRAIGVVVDYVWRTEGRFGAQVNSDESWLLHCR